MSWRVVIATRILPVALGFTAAVSEAGHEPVGLLTLRDLQGSVLGGGLDQVPPELDVLIPARRSSLAPLVGSVRPDLVVCMGFPWKIPADALGVPPLGWLNGHPSLLPLHRGPIPMSWAIRAGDAETGISFHFMDAELDTGPLVAQRSMPIGDYVEPEELYARMGPLVVETLREALERIGRGERGAEQSGGTYESFFGEADVWLDRTRTARELHQLAWAWRYTPAVGTEQGLLVDLDDGPVRVLETSLVEVEGALRIDCADGPIWVVRTEAAEGAPPAPSGRSPSGPTEDG